ncbi:zinc ribbon domain-containing protein [Clostridium cylindrosporum]|uniref:Uncharacterized protein n=1 Tax=Clostridium cylindrosporum DSM 605 TaxID=1121307 RepID=A0A0J8D9U7_CLOCY|nr:zinc ribbon domain-containing protein [Clostridium cylindrosporum]KMT22830.1 hypothetical protein CLCY_5c00690 [Clostridium cylindrosporum DSM 605]
MYCTNCGKKSMEGDRFCAFCGNSIIQYFSLEESENDYVEVNPSYSDEVHLNVKGKITQVIMPRVKVDSIESQLEPLVDVKKTECVGEGLESDEGGVLDIKIPAINKEQSPSKRSSPRRKRSKAKKKALRKMITVICLTLLTVCTAYLGYSFVIKSVEGSVNPDVIINNSK